MKTMLALALWGAATSAFAGIHIGNGGDVVKCPNADKETELLDFMEARILREIPVDLGLPDLPVADKVELALARLERIDRGRANRYRSWAATFEADTRFLTGVVLTDIPDSAHRIIPAGCHIEQVAIHKEPAFPQDRRYIVNKEIWDLLDNDAKAGLILHEVIYREADGFSIENSIGVRYLNSLLFSGLIDQLSSAEYVAILRTIGFKSVHIKSIWLDISEEPAHFHDNGELFQAKLLHKQQVDTEWGRLDLNCRIAFFDDGRIQGLNLARGEEVIIEAWGRPLTFASYRQSAECWKVGDREPAFDVFFEDPDHLQMGSVSWLQPIRVETNEYKLDLAGMTKFDVFGRIVESQTLDGRPGWIRMASTTCSSATGGAGFSERGDLIFVTVKACNVQAASTRLNVKGLVELVRRGGALEVRWAYVGPGSAHHLPVQGNPLALRSGTPVIFYDTGEPFMVTTDQEVRLMFEDGHEEDVAAGSPLTLREDGLVIHYEAPQSGNGRTRGVTSSRKSS